MIRQFERVKEQLKRFMARRSVDATLEITDRAGTQPGALGQRFLRQPASDPVAPQQSAER